MVPDLCLSFQFLTDNASDCEGARPQMQRQLLALRRRKRERRRLDHRRWVPPPLARTKELNPASNKPSAPSLALSQSVYISTRSCDSAVIHHDPAHPSAHAQSCDLTPLLLISLLHVPVSLSLCMSLCVIRGWSICVHPNFIKMLNCC